MSVKLSALSSGLSSIFPRESGNQHHNGIQYIGTKESFDQSQSMNGLSFCVVDSRYDSPRAKSVDSICRPLLTTTKRLLRIQPLGPVELFWWNRYSTAYRVDKRIFRSSHGAKEGLVLESERILRSFAGFGLISHSVLDVTGDLVYLARIVGLCFNEDSVMIARCARRRDEIDIERHNFLMVL